MASSGENYSREIMEFKAHDLITEFPIYVIEDGSGFTVLNKPLERVYGPFETLEEAHEFLANMWDTIIESSSIYESTKN